MVMVMVLSVLVTVWLNEMYTPCSPTCPTRFHLVMDMARSKTEIPYTVAKTLGGLAVTAISKTMPTPTALPSPVKAPIQTLL